MADEAREVNVAAPVEGNVVAETATGEDRDGRRRGRRGGRGRRGESAAATTDQTVSELVAESGDQPAAQAVAPVAAELEPIVIKLESPEPDARLPVAEPAEVKPAPASASVPTQDLSSVGLELVETHGASSADSVEEASEQTASASPSRRRRGGRGRGAAAPAEPLVMVETRSDEVASSEPAQSAPSEWGPPSNPRRRARPQHAAQPAEPLVMVETRHAGEGDDKAA